MSAHNAGKHDPRRTSRGWPVDDPVGESRLAHVLVVVDEASLLADAPTHTPLLERAANVASTIGCRVTLYAPCEDEALAQAFLQPDDTVREHQQTVVDRAATRIAEIAGWLEARNIPTKSRVIWESLESDVLLERIREVKPDLILKSGTSQRFFIGLMTNTDWELLRHSPVPVWYVSSDGDKTAIRTVLTALGASNHPEDVIGAHDYDVCALANLIADRSSARNVLLHTYQIPQRMPPYAAYAPEIAALPPEPAAEGRSRLQQVAKKHGDAIAAFAQYFQMDTDQILLRPGRLNDAIASLSGELHPDLIVMGSRNLSGLQRLLQPLHAESVLAEAPCDVLILPDTAAEDASDKHAPLAVEGTPEFDLEAAVVNPEAVFGEPQALVDHPSLSVALRRRLLTIWENDIRAEMIEEEEGGPVRSSRADQLQQLHQARERLSADTERCSEAIQPEFS